MKRTQEQKAFTLVELLFTLLIIAILVSIALPHYNKVIAKVNRVEGQRALLHIANLQAQYYLDNGRYSNNLTMLALNADPFVTRNKGYQISVKSNEGYDFILTAIALSAQKQNDPACSKMTVDDIGVKTPESHCW